MPQSVDKLINQPSKEDKSAQIFLTTLMNSLDLRERTILRHLRTENRHCGMLNLVSPTYTGDKIGPSALPCITATERVLGLETI